MANFRTNQFSYSFAQPEHLYVKVNIGASGAPTIASNTGMGIASITRSSAGVYVIALSHAYNALLGVKVTNLSTSAVPAAPISYVSDDSVNSTSAPAVTITTAAATSSSVTTLVATDPANGETLILEVVLQKSSVRY